MRGGNVQRPGRHSPSEALHVQTKLQAITEPVQEQVPERSRREPEPERFDPGLELPELAQLAPPARERRSDPPEPARGRSGCTRQGKSRSQARQVLSETSFGNSYAGENGNAVFRIGDS